MFPWIFEVDEDGLDFVAGPHDGRPALRVARALLFQDESGLAKNLSGEEEHPVERLFLGGIRLALAGIFRASRNLFVGRKNSRASRKVSTWTLLRGHGRTCKGKFVACLRSNFWGS